MCDDLKRLGSVFATRQDNKNIEQHLWWYSPQKVCKFHTNIFYTKYILKPNTRFYMKFNNHFFWILIYSWNVSCAITVFNTFDEKNTIINRECNYLFVVYFSYSDVTYFPCTKNQSYLERCKNWLQDIVKKNFLT